MMRFAGRTALAALLLVGGTLPPAPCAGSAAAKLGALRRIGKAYYENDKFSQAAEQYRRAIELAPDSAADRFNLGLVLLRAQEHEEALEVLETAQALDPNLLGVYYLRGIIQKREGRFQEAVKALRHVVDRDSTCRGGYYNLGVCLKFLHDYKGAIDAFRKAVALAPTDPSTHYQLITLYRRTGDVENARRHAEIYEQVKETVDESEKTVEALERSKYTYILLSSRSRVGMKARPPGSARFVEATESSGIRAESPSGADIAPPPLKVSRSEYSDAWVRTRAAPSMGGAAALDDYDGDGDLDLYIVNCGASAAASSNRLYRNDGSGRFEDVTKAARVGDDGAGFDAVFGDYDNDGHDDLYVVNLGPNVLYHNKGDGTFEDVSAAARVDEPQFGRKALFLDYDHDNDLDIFVANHAVTSEIPEGDSFLFPDALSGDANTLLRNNGNGTFSDTTDEAGLLVDLDRSTDAVFADLDGDADVDLFCVNDDAPARFFANARLGKFRPGGSFTPSIQEGGLAAATADFNHDSRLDLVVATTAGLFLYINNGKDAFAGSPVALPAAPEAPAVARIVVLDYNNDGLMDLLLADSGSGRLRLLAGAGAGTFRDDSGSAGLGALGSIAGLAAGDLDGDGDVDIVFARRGGGCGILKNESGKPGAWLEVRLRGKKVNRSGCGATVEVAAQGCYQKQVYGSGGVHFGLGDLQSVDVVRVTWPNGVAQNVIRPEISRVLTVEEFVKVSASCGFLFAFNGKRFELVNEILGIGPLGVPMGPGKFYPVDCTELTRIEGRQLAARDGFFDLRLTEELREITYADKITLRVVDHPKELEVIPLEMFKLPPFPEDRLYAVADPRPPRRAMDDRGTDVLALLARRDGKVPEFPLTRYDGLAEPHALVLDLGDLSEAKRILLFLEGWIYWPDSSVTMAVSQDPRFSIEPLTLEVPDASGRWQVIDGWVGLPTSKGMIVPLDLTGRFPAKDYRVRLRTSLCVYFDRIFVATRDEPERCRGTELPVARAALHYRGFSRMRRDALGFERFDHTDVSPTGSWNPPGGMFTRYGDVTPLLAEPDDRYVIFGPGDELSLRFDARGLPPLPGGWARDFVFYANGWVKDGDLNTTLSATVEPLPFHGMSAYPYPPAEHYPDTPEHRRYLREYNTRPGGRTVGNLSGPGAR